VGAAASLYFFTYLFWKHGGKLGSPIKYLMGFPYTYTNRKVGKECDREYCLDGKGPGVRPKNRRAQRVKAIGDTVKRLTDRVKGIG
jgi:hypothetical protein